VNVRWPEMNWREQHPDLASYSGRMEQRPCFQKSRPTPQKISDKIV
jgi:glutathione S-transferase